MDDYDGGDYIDCTECGHPIEDHRPDGCHTLDDRDDADPCTCTARWTIKAIQAFRRSYSLPGEWRH